jgi:hypothetical protein
MCPPPLAPQATWGEGHVLLGWARGGPGVGMPVCGAGAGGLGTLLRPPLYSNAKYWITTHRPQTGGVVAYPPTRGCGGEYRGWHPTPLRLPLASRFVHSKASVLFVYNSESGPAVYAEELEGSLRVPNQSKGMGRQCVRSSKEVGVGIGGVGWGGVGWGGVEVDVAPRCHWDASQGHTIALLHLAFKSKGWTGPTEAGVLIDTWGHLHVQALAGCRRATPARGGFQPGRRTGEGTKES